MNEINKSEASRALMEIIWFFAQEEPDKKCCYELSMPEFLALEKIACTRDCPVQEVGRRLGFTKSGATRVVNRLETRGYVEKLRSKEDGRICCVVATDNGRNIIHSVTSDFSARLKDTLTKIPEEKSQEIEHSLIALAKAIHK